MTLRTTTLLALALGVLTSSAARAQAPAAPCSLLTDTEVRKAFPDAQTGAPDRRNEKRGIFTCVWSHQGGRVMLITGEESQSPEEEARGWVDTFADPSNGGASQRVRFEKVANVGDAAVAVIESADKTKGFMQDGAYIVVRRGKQQATIMAPALAKRGRAAALGALTDLGRAAALRLK
jgi:hypothetical protein